MPRRWKSANKKRKDPLYARCLRKVRHESYTAALAVMQQLQETDPRGHLLSIYRCIYCGGHHIGHQTE